MGRPSAFLAHPSSLEHDTRGHPEQPARLIAIERELDSHDWFGFERMLSPEADREVLTAVHPSRYVDALEQICSQGGGQLDLDTIVSHGSFAAALHGAGGAVAAVDLLLDGDVQYAFSAHRPPGHHATATRSMGFCLFNNVAVAARYAVQRRGLERVLILDWDVHHGNGTNDIFRTSRDVLYASIHESPLYPGTGPASDVGTGSGKGYTVNLPVPPGSGDSVWLSLVRHVIAPLVTTFAPQLVLISAGYDAHREDPLADCMVTERGFNAMTRTMMRAAAEVEAPLGFVLEGGYALGALARSVAATLQALAQGVEADEEIGVAPQSLAALDRLAPWWPGLRAGVSD